MEPTNQPAQDQLAATPPAANDQVQEKTKAVFKIKYTYDVYFKGNQRVPAFELSVVETEPEKLKGKILAILAQNVRIENIPDYVYLLKSMEVLE